ncbi:RteC domain-containing protein [Flavobacterium sp. PL002]|uniref:RteC domain-containing protein n=1 Tax=Flavobacterium sp. PL002 TaxID=1897058 RepID=UPI001787AA4E|nr:RteC domain-containing protein [Flavobacterium sp. PL002]
MKLFSESLQLEINCQLEMITTQSQELVEQSEQAIKVLITALEKLKAFSINYKFEDKKEEVNFFKNIKPQFTATLIYFKEINAIESKKPYGSKKKLCKYYTNEIRKLKNFFNKNQELHQYHKTNNSCLDKKYFVRGKYNIKLTPDSFYFQADERFSTAHDYKWAKIIANEVLKTKVESLIKKLTKNPEQGQPYKKQKWTASKVELIELIYALHTAGVLNHGKSGLQEITKCIESVFDINLGQFHRVFIEMRNRKSERTKFLTSLRNNLLIRMENADEN